MIHRWPIRVYYEDTDLAGLVYYANYLKFIERARSEMVREAGIDQAEMKRARGIVFAVRRVEADYLAAAHYDDELVVETTLDSLSGARFDMPQTVRRGDQPIFQAKVSVVCIGPAGRATRLPADIRQKLETISMLTRG
ncbi:tol-pal system-associated acyl-CoA thioesterase [Rhodophyticola porphyridii]|uniref:Tol-pal system-associated acyl-CoA thioesterase n=1 Tax=Rhodophyticola porphyridii TaxID=1852017 RepID=A0A3L9YCL4_9RHOB|nr:tol-pal system-associated acyl-CoA thioesterase [Rhodophyticola porphyridii]RMA43913.1 tol-pal system-associated acyl-CoA thioesterase [Rhodophyticola porphyridii]